MKIVYILISVALVMAVLECEPVEAGWFSKIKKAAKKALEAAKKKEKFAKCMIRCSSKRSRFVQAICAANCKKYFKK